MHDVHVKAGLGPSCNFLSIECFLVRLPSLISAAEAEQNPDGRDEREEGTVLQVMEKKKRRKKKRVLANLSASYEFVKQLSSRSPLTSSSSSTLPAPPMSVNPLVKKQMFHHRGTSAQGCLTRRMECLLLLLGRQQTAGWESGQEERQESQSECQLAGLRLQQRHLPASRKHPRTHANKRARALALSRRSCSESERPLRTRARTHARTHAQPESPGRRLSAARACDTEAEGICCGLLLD